jgi:WD40 repeat protein
MWAEWPVASFPSFAAWSPDSQLVVFSGPGTDQLPAWAILLDIPARQVIWQTNDLISHPVFSPDGQYIVGTTNQIQFWNVADGQLAEASERSGFIFLTDFIPDGLALVVGATSLFQPEESPSSDIGIWDRDQARLTNIARLDGLLWSMDINGDGTLLATGLTDIPNVEEDRRVFLWEYPSMEKRCDLPGQSARFGGNSQVVAISDNNGEISLFDVQTCQIMATVQSRATALYGTVNFSLSPDGNTLAFESLHCCTVEFFDLSTETIIYEQDLLGKQIAFLAFSPDGKYLLSTVTDTSGPSENVQTLQIWKVDLSSR